MRLINRYLYKEILTLFSFILLACFFLYALFDYSLHIKQFHQDKLPGFEIVVYYFAQFSERIDILVPLSLMITTIKVLTSMNQKFELVALLSSGLSFKKIVRPFILTSLMLMAFSYLNFQYLHPLAFTSVKAFEKRYLKNKHGGQAPLYSLTLPNNALLLFQHFDPNTKLFSRLFLIENPDHIYKMDALALLDDKSEGKSVDLLYRNDAGEITKKSHLETFSFPKIEVDLKNLEKESIALRMQSLSWLYKKLLIGGFGRGFYKMSNKEASAMTYFSYKMFIPFLSLLAVVAPLSFATQYNRKLPLFLLYASFLFGLFSLFAFINACVILSLHQILTPFWTIAVALSICFFIFGFRYAKL